MKALTAGTFVAIATLVFVTAAFAATGQVVLPGRDGDIILGPTVQLAATYDDGDGVNDDLIDWAVRTDSNCAGTTVKGNVSGFSDLFDWDGASFSASVELPAGDYCFVFNPRDDDLPDVRATRLFTVVDSIGKDDCKGNGWERFISPVFKNQGDCVSYVTTTGENDPVQNVP
jgi:hypothetical protein